MCFLTKVIKYPIITPINIRMDGLYVYVKVGN